jgi:hypothetical protein
MCSPPDDPSENALLVLDKNRGFVDANKIIQILVQYGRCWLPIFLCEFAATSLLESKTTKNAPKKKMDDRTEQLPSALTNAEEDTSATKKPHASEETD